jgi:hypothetical protein
MLANPAAGTRSARAARSINAGQTRHGDRTPRRAHSARGSVDQRDGSEGESGPSVGGGLPFPRAIPAEPVAPRDEATGGSARMTHALSPPGSHRRRGHCTGSRCGRHRAPVGAAARSFRGHAARATAGAAACDLPALARRTWRDDRRGPGDPLPGAALVHRRRRARAAGPRWAGGAAAAAGTLPRTGRRDRPGDGPAAPAGPAPGGTGRVHAARLPQRQARPRAGRGRRRPDRREHRGGGAFRRPLAQRCVLGRDRCSARPHGRTAHARRGHARLSRGGGRFPREGRRPRPDRPPARGGRCGARARPRGGARARYGEKESRCCCPTIPTSARARC